MPHSQYGVSWRRITSTCLPGMLSADVLIHQELWHHCRPAACFHEESGGVPETLKENEVYYKAFRELKAAILDSANFLHHKDPLKHLFLEVDASDSGWGAGAYQLVEDWIGDLQSEGRGRQDHTGPRQVTQWTSKAWTPFELKLPVFYRESLA